MIIIFNNDVMIFATKFVLFDLKSIISYKMHYNKSKSFCHALTDSFSRLVSILTFLLFHGQSD